MCKLDDYLRLFWKGLSSKLLQGWRHRGDSKSNFSVLILIEVILKTKLDLLNFASLVYRLLLMNSKDLRSYVQFC